MEAIREDLSLEPLDFGELLFGVLTLKILIMLLKLDDLFFSVIAALIEGGGFKRLASSDMFIFLLVVFSTLPTLKDLVLFC